MKKPRYQLCNSIDVDGSVFIADMETNKIVWTAQDIPDWLVSAMTAQEQEQSEPLTKSDLIEQFFKEKGVAVERLKAVHDESDWRGLPFVKTDAQRLEEKAQSAFTTVRELWDAGEKDAVVAMVTYVVRSDHKISGTKAFIDFATGEIGKYFQTLDWKAPKLMPFEEVIATYARVLGLPEDAIEELKERLK